MPTYTIDCAECGDTRYPFIDGPRPASYVCARCTATPPEERARRRAAGQKAREAYLTKLNREMEQ